MQLETDVFLKNRVALQLCFFGRLLFPYPFPDSKYFHFFVYNDISCVYNKKYDISIRSAEKENKNYSKKRLGGMV